MIAAIYARKSTDDSDRDAEARSCERQIDHARRYAAAQGWTVDERHVYRDDAVSGAEWKHRPGWTALLATLAPAPPFGVLIVSELSRIGRDSVRTPVAVLAVEEAGVEIHSYLNRGRISLADEAGEMSTMLHSLLASFERRRASDRTKDALRRRFDANAATGGAAYGYKIVRTGGPYAHYVIGPDRSGHRAPGVRVVRRGRRARPDRQATDGGAGAGAPRRHVLGGGAATADAAPTDLRGASVLCLHGDEPPRRHQGAARAARRGMAGARGPRADDRGPGSLAPRPGLA